MEIFIELQRNNLLKDITIITASHPETIESKRKHFEYKILGELKEIFKIISEKEPENTLFSNGVPLTYQSNLITENNKEKRVINGLIYEDAIHNAMDIVTTNEMGYVILQDYEHNQDIQTGKRIKRIHSPNEYFSTLIYMSLDKYIRQKEQDKPKDIEKIKTKDISNGNYKKNI